MPTVLLVRHGQASFGEADYDVLSDLGRRQSELLGSALARRGTRATRLVSGELHRQLGTAERLAAALGVETEADARWNEYDDADVISHHSGSTARLGRNADGSPSLSSDAFQAVIDDALAAWIEAGEDGPAGEPWSRFSGRAHAALEDLAASLGAGETGIAVSSGGTIAALAAALLGAPPQTMVALNRVAVNTGVSKVAIGRRGATLVSYNEHAHLDEAGRELLSYR
jgi:broad specificity phosphatase PhoE